jgi:kynurenine formamidase
VAKGIGGAYTGRERQNPPMRARTDRGSVLIDLTLELANDMPAGPFASPPVVLPFATHEQTREAGLGTESDAYSYALSYIAMVAHAGTHVDAPLHFAPRRASIDEMPLDWFTGRAVCLDLRHIPDLGEIDVRWLERAEEEAGVKIDGHIVLLCTGFHARRWPDPRMIDSNPGLSAEATHWLADRRSRAHGIDAPSTDKGGSRALPSHRVCRDRSLLHYEWLVNLEQLVGKGEFVFHGYPLRWKEGTGSPVRAIAELPR